MQSVFHMRSVVVVVLFLVRNCIAPDGFCLGSAVGEEPLQRPTQSALTAALRQHNASSLVATLEREAQQGVRLTPEQTNFLLSAGWSPTKGEPPSEAMPPSLGDMMRKRDFQQMITPQSTHSYGSLGETLVAARGVADKARQHLSEFLGLNGENKGLLHWWNENGAPAVKAAMASLFGHRRAPPPAEVDIKELEALLAALQQQQQLQEWNSAIVSGTAAQENSAAAAGSDRDIPSRRIPNNDRGVDTIARQQFLRSAEGGAAPAVHTGFTAPGDEYTARHEVPPAFPELDRGAIEKEQTMETISRHGEGGPILSLLHSDPSGGSLEDILNTVAGAFDFENAAASSEGLGLQAAHGLSSLLPLGLPSMRFSALSILAEGDTLKNWSSLVKMVKQRGQADYASPAALDVIEKLAVVLACAYKTAKTFLGEQQAVLLIRSAIRQNASFKEQIYSAVRKNLEGGEPDEEAAQSTEGSMLLGKLSPSEQKGQLDIEARLLRELLVKISHMPPSFFHHLSQKYRKMLDRWGVESSELQSIVKEALVLKFPLNDEGESHASRLGKRFESAGWTLEKGAGAPADGS